MNKLTTSGYGAIFLCIAVYFCFFFNHHLLIVEQTQVFQLSKHYWNSLISVPGGVSNYIGAFVSQFNIFNRVGGILITAVTLLLFWLQIHVGKECGSKKMGAFSLLVPLAAALFFSDENARIGGAFAVLLSSGASLLVLQQKSTWLRSLVAVVLLPVLYWVTGGAVWTFVSIITVVGLTQRRIPLVLIALLLFGTAALPLLTCQLLTPLAENNAWLGSAFYSSQPYRLMAWGFIVVPAIAALLSSIYTRWFSEKQNVKIISQVISLFFLLLLVVLLSVKHNKEREELYALDYLLKKQQWNRLIERAKKSPQQNLFFVSYVNVALLNRGRLPDEMMHFSQRPESNEFWTPNYLPMVLTAETYYCLDMFDAARAYFFMANMQAPQACSPFLYQRLAELECIRGCELSGLKFVKALKNTLFYRRWALEMEQAIITGNYPHELQKKIEKYKPNKTFLAKEMLYNIGCKHLAEPTNRKIHDFLLFKQILAEDYKGFIYNLNRTPKELQTKLPRTYQEFLLMYAYMTQDNSLIEKWGISKAVLTDFYNYLELNQSEQNPETIKKKLRESYGHSYWYYVQYKN